MKTWDEMTARERDALVAVEVMGEPKPTTNVPPGVLSGFATSSSGGGNWIGTTSGYDSGDEPTWMPKPFTTDIAAAWEMVEKAGLSLLQTDDGWLAFDPGPHGQISYPEPGVHNGLVDLEILVGSPWAVAPTAQEAASLAALRAKGVDV